MLVKKRMPVPRGEMADLITTASAASQQRTSARALRLGRRLKMTGLEIAEIGQGEAITTSPLLFRVGERGFAALFPYGAAVLIGVSRTDEELFLQKLSDHIEGRLDTPVINASEIEIGAGEDISGGFITVRDLSPPRLVVVADALAKNVSLAFEEEEVRKVFEVLEPFANDLADFGRLPRNRRRVLQTVGLALRIHHQLFERVDVEETPALLRNNDEIKHLHEHLAKTYHFKKRDEALSRKVEAIELMTTAITELLNAQREVWLEVTIILLLVVEIAINFIDFFFPPS
jgi:uncharacterized Rmd1/YagE family protein